MAPDYIVTVSAGEFPLHCQQQDRRGPRREPAGGSPGAGACKV